MTTCEYTGEQLTRVTAPGNRITSYAYDTLHQDGRRYALTAITHPDNSHSTFDYDDKGRLTATAKDGGVTITDSTGRATALSYGLGGQLAQVRDGEGRTVRLGYNASSQLSQLTGPGGEQYRYAYDAGATSPASMTRCATPAPSPTNRLSTTSTA